MGISFRLLSVEDIGDLRELLENDGMLYHPQYLAHFLCHPELALSARSKKIDQWECLLLSLVAVGWKDHVFSVFAGHFTRLARTWS